MEACPASAGPEASPAEGRHIDLTEDLAQQLEDIISTYQADEDPAEPEDGDEVTAVREPLTRRDQKLQKKMLKNLGGVFFKYILYIYIYYIYIKNNLMYICNMYILYIYIY